MRIRTTHPTETWKLIPGFSYYMASNLGRIKSLSREIRFGKQWRIAPEHIKTPQPHNSGYHQMRLVDNEGKKINCYVHRLVTETFLGIGEAMTVNHKDCDKHNNQLSNLEAVSQSSNVKHANINNRKMGKQKLTIEQVKEIRHLCDTTRIPLSSIARQYDVSRSHVSNIAKRLK